MGSFALKKQKNISEPSSQEKEPVLEHRDVNKGKGMRDQKEPVREEAPAGDIKEVKRGSQKRIDTPTLEDNMVPDDVKPQITPASKTDRKPGTKPQSQSKPNTTAKQAPEGTMIKPKLKSVKQAEVVESPLEKLKRLENAQPTEVEELETEEEIVSTLPMYNIPSKREKTDLKEYDSPDKERQQKLQPEKDEPLPDWERLKKKPESKKDPNEIVLGRGTIPGKKSILLTSDFLY